MVASCHSPLWRTRGSAGEPTPAHHSRGATKGSRDFAADQRAPRRLNRATAQSAMPIACVYPFPLSGQRSLSNDMSPAVLVAPLSLLQLQLNFALCTVETGQSGASSGRLTAAASASTNSVRWAALIIFGLSCSRGGLCFFSICLAVSRSTSKTLPLTSAVPPMTVTVISLCQAPPSPLPRSTFSSASFEVPTHA